MSDTAPQLQVDETVVRAQRLVHDSLRQLPSGFRPVERDGDSPESPLSGRLRAAIDKVEA